MKKRIMSVVKQVFLKEEENQRLEKLMEQSGETNFSEFARKKLLRTDIDVWVIDFSDFDSYTELLTAIGREINQIAKVSTQTGGVLFEDKVRVGQVMQQVITILEEKYVSIQERSR